MANQRSGCFLSVLVVLLVCSVLGNFLLLAIVGSKGATSSFISGKEPPKFEETIVTTGDDNKIALITLRGIITSADPARSASPRSTT